MENFFDIIYNVHVELEGRPGKHAGQKRTYRTITETYAFLPREAVTRFLLGCTECQKHPRSPSPVSVLPTPSPSPTLPLITNNTNNVLSLATHPPAPQATPVPSRLTPLTDSEQPVYLDISNSIPERKSPLHINVTTSSAQPITLNLIQRTQDIPSLNHANVIKPTTQNQTVKIEQSLKIDQNIQLDQNLKVEHTLKIEQQPLRTATPDFNGSKRSSNPLDVCNLTSKDPPKTPPKKRHLINLSNNYHNSQPSQGPKLWSPIASLEQDKKKDIPPEEIDFSMPITTTYLKYMRSLGCTDEDALKFENKTVSLVIDKLMHEIISQYYY